MQSLEILGGISRRRRGGGEIYLARAPRECRGSEKESERKVDGKNDLFIKRSGSVWLPRALSIMQNLDARDGGLTQITRRKEKEKQR